MVRSTGKISVQTTDNFDFTTEIVDIGQGRIMTFVHLDVWYFSHNIYRELKEAFDFHRPNFPQLIFTQPRVFDKKFHKFITRFGFTIISEGINANGDPLPYYIHED